MLKNYIYTALRRLLKNKALSIINILGLTVAITAFLLMSMYIESEQTYDAFHTNANRIYRVTTFKQTPEASFNRAETSAPVGPAMLADFSEVEKVVRIMKADALFKYKNVSGQEGNLIFADPDIFNVFSFEWVKGDKDNSLNKPFSIVLTEETATRYFANEDPIGKDITLDGNQIFFVTGVVRSLPQNSHFGCDALLSMSTAEQKDSGYDWLFTNWYSEAFHTYLLLKNTADVNDIRTNMASFEQRHKQRDDTRYEYSLEKLTDIYLKSKADDQFGKTGSLTNIYAFTAIAFFIILIASINFINLTMAQSSERAKEIGVRKVTGATRRQLQKQFLLESLIVTLMACFFAVCLCQIMLPVFNQFAGKELVLNLGHTTYILYGLLFVVIISVLAGFLPAFVISNLKTVQALKGKQKTSSGGIRFREALVVFQFALSAGLIVSCLVVYYQLNYVDGFNVGFNRDRIMILKTHGDKNVNGHLESFKEQMKQVNGVEKVCVSSLVPGDGKSGWSMDISYQGQIIKTELPVFLVDHDFLDLYEIPVLTGRGLSREFSQDTLESMLLNETALRSLGITKNEDAIGMVVDMYPSKGKVVGVFKDFNFESLHEKIEPLAVRMLPTMLRKVSLKINASDMKSTVEQIEIKWKQLVPSRPMEYSFLEEDFDNQYKAEEKFGQVFITFTILAVLIACIGLYGLSLITTQQRRKEIGIRKIVGATSYQLLLLLTKDYVRLVIISFFIGFPAAYYCMTMWLSYFSYKIEISSGIFILATVISISIAILTVFSQTLKTAMANPTESVRAD